MNNSFELIPFLTFAIITSITPGPNNISAMSFSMKLGYRNTLPYIIGVASGTTLMMLVCALLAFGLSAIAPQITGYLKFVGAAYILFLAYKTLKINIETKDNSKTKARYIDGLLLQLVNPKAIFYGMTIYSTFFAFLVDEQFWLAISALGIGLLTFTNVSIWGLFGSVIRQYLKNDRIKTVFAVIMALGLIYAAYKVLMV